jgi:DNA repair protein RecO (recombination protein O)
LLNRQRRAAKKEKDAPQAVSFRVRYNPSMPSRERVSRAEAIVLRHIDWGEADRLLWLFTRESGKIRAVAKGIRKPRSRKAGHLEPFTRVNLLLAQGRDMPIVTQAEMVESHLPLREDLQRMGYAAYVVELLDRFTYEEGENIQMFHLLADTLSRLCGDQDTAFAVRYYEMRLLDLVGFRPQLARCMVCGAEIRPEDQYFSAVQGGLLCPKCGERFPGARSITLGAVRFMRHIQRSTYEEAARLPLKNGVDEELEQLMQYYFTYLLERGLNTPAFLRLIDKKGGMR